MTTLKERAVRCSASGRWMPNSYWGQQVLCPECGAPTLITQLCEIRAHHTGKTTVEARAVARRVRLAPPLLRNMAAAQATTPTALIVERLQTYPTNAEAAASLGVTRNTLWRWMCRLGIAVETTYE